MKTDHIPKENDREVLLLSQDKRFWDLFDKSVKSGEEKGWTALEDLPE